VDTFQSEQGLLFFGSDDIEKKCATKVHIVSFGVEYIGVNESRVVWRLSREGQMDYSEIAHGFPIGYGEDLFGMKEHVAPLGVLPGKYRVGAEVVCRSNNEVESMLLFGNFIITSDGKLVSNLKK